MGSAETNVQIPKRVYCKELEEIGIPQGNRRTVALERGLQSRNEDVRTGILDLQFGMYQAARM
jgi:hypothetical protein